MYKFLILLALPALIVAQQGGYEHALEEFFNMGDIDGNEHFTLAEATTILTNMDANGDGNIDRTEFDAVLAADPVYAGFEDQLFNTLDISMDGILTGADMGTLFSAYDTNGDGEISKGEFLQPHTSHGPARV